MISGYACRGKCGNGNAFGMCTQTSYIRGMRRMKLSLSFTDEDGTTRKEDRHLETSYPGELAGEHRVLHILLSELTVSVGPQAEPKHNAVAQEWLDFPHRPASIVEYFDIRNSQSMWIELSSLIMGAEGDLILAKAFKGLEPGAEPAFEDTVGLNDLYYLHDRKLNLLNQCVHALTKVQDLVNRLLHESLGGDLVDTGKPDWERTQLTREKVEKGLERKRAAGSLSQSDYDRITQALAIPMKAPKAELAMAYRNRLMHHIRPSVDYSVFFSSLESRIGEEMRDAYGKVIGTRHVIRSRAPVQYRFEELYAAFSECLDAVMAMLERLSKLEILRR